MLPWWLNHRRVRRRNHGAFTVTTDANDVGLLANLSVCSLANVLLATAAQFAQAINVAVCVWFMWDKMSSGCNSS